ncbi:MAG: winged helix-turn-helix transcriptional regulator [Nitrososphaeria archaeon]|nr:winged helix-turn-helix transcriptional regulator [Nitrososphaeria archaeon]NIN52059.1 winged helix-turn-helix transcriptional regulator [Nitrososphaeria archaeon]NIQ32520.1 winged helix-turn-helix transcriptional regulator [Nitrososphaeria archaeon]
MDETDRKIIRMLQQNARVKYTEIAESIGVPEATVRYRVKSLLSEGIIKKFTVEVSSHGIRCLVFIRADPKTELSDICQQILKLGDEEEQVQRVEFIHEITGDFDCVTLVRGRTPQELNELIDKIRTIPGVLATSSNLILREHR